MEQTLGLSVTVVRKPRRWVIERTFAWLGRYRRLSKDDEVLPASEEAWSYLATTNLLVRRLARDPFPTLKFAGWILRPSSA